MTTGAECRPRDPVSLYIQGLTVSFPDFQLGPVDMSLGPGITAILGHNGSGKTTLLRAINGMLPEAHGAAVTDDYDLMGRDVESRRRSVFVPDGDDLLFPELTANQFWSFLVGIREKSFGDDPERLIERIAGLSEQLGLEPGDARLGNFSLGMKRKMQIICGVSADPDLLIVDEPQSGLDFISSREVRTILTELRDRGSTVVMSNHDLDSVARVADHVVILRDGQVVGRSEEKFQSGQDCEDFVARFFR